MYWKLLGGEGGAVDEKYRFIVKYAHKNNIMNDVLYVLSCRREMYNNSHAVNIHGFTASHEWKHNTIHTRHNNWFSGNDECTCPCFIRIKDMNGQCFRRFKAQCL